MAGNNIPKGSTNNLRESYVESRTSFLGISLKAIIDTHRKSSHVITMH
jgi:hypothetical protein